MKRTSISLLIFLGGVFFVAGGSKGTGGLELRLEPGRVALFVGEPSDIRLFLVNKGSEAVLVDRGFLMLEIEMEMGGEWFACSQTQFAILPGVREKAQWERIETGAELLIGLGGFWCPEDAGPASRGRSWRDNPGDYKLRVEASHRMPAHALEQTGPAPDGAREWTLRSQAVAMSVKEPKGIDADALRWAREHGYDPEFSVELANRFPESRYANWVVWRLMTIGDASPETTMDLIGRGLYPKGRSVPDPSSPDGWRKIGSVADMARWRIDQGERLLREQPGFLYERDVRLSVAVSYAAMGNKERSTELLNAVKSAKGTPEGQWAARFLALQGW